MNVKKIIAGAAVAAALVPALALAQIDTRTQTEIQSLITQIQELQRRLVLLLGSIGTFKPIGAEGTQGIVSGTISAVASSSITVQNRDGSRSTVVHYTASTTIEVFSTTTPEWRAGTTADLVVGKAVGVQGTPNTEGTVDATRIKVGIVLTAANRVGGLPPGQVGKAMCIALHRNLGPGSRGDDVRKVQEMLASDSSLGFNALPTGLWGPISAKAMMAFQRKNGITPSDDGSVGPLTRGLFLRRCGEGLVNTQDARYLVGTITANNGSSISLQARHGERSTTVYIASSTVITIVNSSAGPTTGTISDLTVGKFVEVKGVWDNQGEGKSMTATHIRVGIWQPPAVPVTPPPTTTSDDDDDTCAEGDTTCDQNEDADDEDQEDEDEDEDEDDDEEDDD